MASGDYRKGYELLTFTQGLHFATKKQKGKTAENPKETRVVFALSVKTRQHANKVGTLRKVALLTQSLDPIGAVSGARPDRYGFVNGGTLEVFWP